MKGTSLTILLLFTGIVVSIIGFETTFWLGSGWITEKSTLPWGLNTYIRIPAHIAYAYCGVLSVWLSGLFTGFLVGLVLRKVYTKTVLLPLFPAIIFSALGFNTMDWMLAHVIASEKEWQAWVIWQPNLRLESWNFYFFLGITPLFIGGMLISLSLTRLA